MPETLTFDVVVPSSRPSVAVLGSLAALRQPAGLTARFIIVVDRPDADISDLLRAAKETPNVVIVVNDSIVGASASRNRGISAGSGEFVLFLDDDVQPDEDLLHAYADAIRLDTDKHPGF